MIAFKMKTFLKIFAICFLLGALLWKISQGQDIVFKDNEGEDREAQVNPMEVTFPNSKESNEPCMTQSGGKGLCKTTEDCPAMHSMTEQQLMHLSSCGWKSASIPVVCCPQDFVLSTRSSSPDIKRPVYDFLSCGIPFDTTSLNGSLASIYKTNDTAKEFEKEGFTITPQEMDEDLLLTYVMSNETHTFEMKSQPFKEGSGRGGMPARRGLTAFMALIGERNGKRPKWFCVGVIINRKWILSAAHCFVEKKPEVIRLGEYNINDDTVTDLEFPMDYGMAGMIFHPDYSYPSSYHDLALIRLNTTIPYHRPDMTPICLPWEDEAKRNLIGKQVTLLGWGANTYDGPMATIAQEVNVTVFNSSVCDSSYSKLSDYSEKFPDGIKPTTSLCAGDINGGKDSCRGDSGGPIVYQDTHGQHILAGIVSTGFGCGLRDFPGIYVPLLKPEYLIWIKQIAFT